MCWACRQQSGTIQTGTFLYFDFKPVRHRDSNNEGPNALVAYGRFGRGRLRYWRRDASNAGCCKTLGAALEDLQMCGGRWCVLTCGERQGGVCLGIKRHGLVDKLSWFMAQQGPPD